jgi:hypothetical protein
MSVACDVMSSERLSDTLFPNDELVELSLILPRWQIDALATTARQRGLTAGQVLRRLIGAYCTDTEFHRRPAQS